ncbi:MAG TPA: hypothetical protein PKK00_01465 [Bacteroidales bacterium]|nr:hypothetical protein [Bacteroidales bacterium]HPS16122.1 hypothetical protein [Bacteroidales bacterium]
MKEDKLEKFIRDNRSQFDADEPSDALWDKISNDIEIKKRKNIFWIRIAWQVAAAVIIFFTAWYLKDLTQSSSTANATAMRSNIKLHPVIKIVKPVETPLQQVQTTNNYIAETKNNVVAKPQHDDVLPAELLEATQYYTIQINQTRNMMIHYASYSPDIDKQVNVEFAKLDTVYKSLRNDLKDNINNSEVVEAMILNYRMRLEILENILEQLKSIVNKDEKKKQYEI